MTLFDNTSPVYAARHWRNMPTEQEDTLEGFLSWIEYNDSAPTISEEEFKTVEALVNAYLGRDMEKVAKGEQELLKKRS